MKISKRDKMLLLIVVGLVVVLCTYYFVFLSFQEKTEMLEAENVVLEDVIVKLKDLDKNREQYLADTEKYTEDNERIKDEFPAGMEEEDDILYVDGLEGTLSEFYASSVGLPSSVGYELTYPAVETISVDAMLQGTVTATAENTEGENTEAATLTSDNMSPSCQLWYVPVTTSYEVNYLSLKQLVKAITDDSAKKSVEDISITYNEENGILSGTLTSNFYYLSGTDEVYATPEVEGISIGTSNPFRSVR